MIKENYSELMAPATVERVREIVAMTVYGAKRLFVADDEIQAVCTLKQFVGQEVTGQNISVLSRDQVSDKLIQMTELSGDGGKLNILQPVDLVLYFIEDSIGSILSANGYSKEQILEIFDSIVDLLPKVLEQFLSPEMLISIRLGDLPDLLGHKKRFLTILANELGKELNLDLLAMAGNSKIPPLHALLDIDLSGYNGPRAKQFSIQYLLSMLHIFSLGGTKVLFRTGFPGLAADIGDQYALSPGLPFSSAQIIEKFRGQDYPQTIAAKFNDPNLWRNNGEG